MSHRLTWTFAEARPSSPRFSPRPGKAGGEDDAEGQLGPVVEGHGPGSPDNPVAEDQRCGDRDAQDRTRGPDDQAPCRPLTRVEDLLDGQADRPERMAGREEGD